MAEEPEIPIQNKYAKQYADDIEQIRRKLDELKAEEEWLLKQLDAATGAALSGIAESGEAPVPEQGQSVPADAAAPVPPQRKDVRAPAAASKPAAKGKAASRKTRKTKAEAKTPAKEAAAPGGGARKGPPLHELLLAMLRQNPREPRTTSEMHTQLIQDHPDRETSINVVRNGLESLVARSLAARDLQQGSVMYTATVGPGADGTVAEAGPDESAGSDETVSVKADEKAGAAV